MHRPATYDVTVLGGGPAGAATALALRRLGVPEVLLVERDDFRKVRIGESIPPETRLLLKDLGVWQEFLSEGHEPALGSCSAWGSDDLGYNDFLFNPHGHGWHLDRRRFDAFLVRAARAAGVVVRLRTRCAAVERLDDRGCRIALEANDGPGLVNARFVVDATGSHSRLTRSLGGVPRFHDRLSYVAAFFKRTDGAFSRSTWLEAVEYGWWYAAMLPAGRVVVAVASDPDVIKAKALHQPESWRSCFEQTRHLAARFAHCEACPGPLRVRTAWSAVLDRPWGSGWLAVGDAASSYDPISSQGIYKSLLEGREAAKAVVDWLGGTSAGVEAYGATINGRFADYLGLRNYFYDLEQRWPTAPFWARRRSRRRAQARRPDDKQGRSQR